MNKNKTCKLEVNLANSLNCHKIIDFLVIIYELNPYRRITI